MRKKQRGALEIIMALAIVILMAAVSLTNAMLSGVQNRQSLERLDRQESFNSNEVVAWAAETQVGTNGQLVALDNNYVDSLPSTIQIQNIPNNSTPGTPYNVKTTAQFDKEGGAPARSLVRRYNASASNLSFRVPPNGSRCGSMTLGRASRQLCLASQAVSPAPPPPSPNNDCGYPINYPGPGTPLASASDFKKIQSGTATAGTYYYLANDIVIDGAKGDTLPLFGVYGLGPLVGPFALNGNNHKITVKNFNFTAPKAMIGAIGPAAILENLVIDMQVNWVELVDFWADGGGAYNVDLQTSTGATWGNGFPITVFNFGQLGILAANKQGCNCGLPHDATFTESVPVKYHNVYNLTQTSSGPLPIPPFPTTLLTPPCLK